MNSIEVVNCDIISEKARLVHNIIVGAMKDVAKNHPQMSLCDAAASVTKRCCFSILNELAKHERLNAKK